MPSISNRSEIIFRACQNNRRAAHHAQLVREMLVASCNLHRSRGFNQVMFNTLVDGGPIWIAVATTAELTVFGLAFWIGFRMRLKQKIISAQQSTTAEPDSENKLTATDANTV
jgi:hypothetical protein